MTAKRTYADACGISRALDLVGERWALLVVRELLLGPKRFTDIREGLPHLSPDVLAQRLRDLEQAQLVKRRKLPPPAASQVYELTERGAALEPVLMALGRWGGANAPPPADGVGMSLEAHILSLRALFEPELAGDFRATLELRLGEHHYRVIIADGRIEAVRGEATAPDATIETDPGTLLALLHGRRELSDALGAGDIDIEGDEQAVARFLGLFPLPEPAAV
ncbi:MAG: winged helix-turn-helix transcriptional regulator [Actinomycetota bacterium]|nr:winged helix-turn-helix transcriptional regulator [Actinomycetota bacterium]